MENQSLNLKSKTMEKAILAAHVPLSYDSHIKIENAKNEYRLSLDFCPSDLVMISKLHTDANPNFSESTNDIDEVIEIAVNFHKKYKSADWETGDDWLSTIVGFYNGVAMRKNWNRISPE